MEILPILLGLTIAVWVILVSISIDGKPLWKIVRDKDTSWMKK